MRRIMLSIGIHEHQHLAGSRSRAALDRRSIAHRVRRRQYPGTLPGGHRGGVVGGPVIHHDYLGLREQGPERRQSAAQALGLVLGGQDD